MKKIIAILSFLCLALFVSAQDKIIQSYGRAGAIFITDVGHAHGFATHKLLHNAAKIAAYNYTFQINTPSAYQFAASVHIRDYEAGTANTGTVILKGSVDNVGYVALDTIDYASVADSLTCIFNSNDIYYPNADTFAAHPFAYKFLSLTVTPVGDSLWVKSIYMNVLPVH